MDREERTSKVKRKPIIGMTCGYEEEVRERFYINRTYIQSIEMAGGIPLLLPGLAEAENLLPLLEQLDGVLLPGGWDLDPAYWGEEPMGVGTINPISDELDLTVARWALDRGLPILGICRGAQVLNVAAGGSLYQDIPSEVVQSLKHAQDAPRWQHSHWISIEPGSILEGMLGTTKLRVNSFHHQAVKDLAPGFRVTAAAKDGVTEAIESTDLPFAVGVQWHPETMWGHYPIFKGIFTALIEAALPGAAARNVG